MGKLIIFIIIILLLIGGSYYFFFAERGITPSEKSDQASLSAEETLSTSNEPAAIEQELQATELGNLDQEFTDINTEIESALQEAGL